MDEKNIEELLNNMLKEAGETAIDEMTKEDLEHLEDAYPYEVSKEHESKMKELFETVYEKDTEVEESDKAQNSKTSKGKALKKIFVIAAAAVLILALMISSVGAWRESFVKYFLKEKEEYSDINSYNKNSRGGKDFWADDVYFGYLPEGYELVYEKKMSSKTMINFEKGGEFYIIFDSSKSSFIPRINTESGEVQDIVINNKDMVYSENDMYKVLSWNENNRTNVLSANESKEVLIKIAENIKFIDEKSQGE